MIKKNHLKIFLFLIFNSVLILSAQSQNRKYFIITGKIISECESSGNAFIQIKKQDKDSLVFPIQLNGKFRLELDYNSNYKITFTQAGLLSKTILVNTSIPQEVLMRAENFSHFVMGVRLFKDNLNPENSNSENQVQQIAYSPVIDEFYRIQTQSDILFVEKENKLKKSGILHAEDSKISMQSVGTY